MTAGPLTPPDLADHFGLTRREGEITLLIDSGLGTADIARLLGLSRHTVRRHLERVFAKTQVHSRTALLARLRTVSSE